MLKNSTSVELDSLILDALCKNSLTHHGIKGQKWGVRRTAGQLGRVKSKLSGDPESADRKKISNLKKKNAKSLSNKELIEINKRLQMEKQYKDLTKKEVSKGKKFVADIMVKSATSALTTFTTAQMNKGIAKAMGTTVPAAKKKTG